MPEGQITPDYKEVPISAAREIALEFLKASVVIVSWDDRGNMLHFTSYGTSARAKVMAALLSEACAKAIAGEPRTTFHDFRHIPAAERAVEVEKLIGLLRWFCGKCEGDSGTGVAYWWQFPEFVEAKAAIGEPLSPELLAELRGKGL